MHSAARKGDLTELQDLVIKKKADVNRPNTEHRTVLHIACAEGRMEIVTWLISNGADVNFTDRNGHTPLDDALKKGHYDISNYLIAKG
jgi:ankyrin repeat protein